MSAHAEPRALTWRRLQRRPSESGPRLQRACGKLAVVALLTGLWGFNSAHGETFSQPAISRPVERPPSIPTSGHAYLGAYVNPKGLPIGKGAVDDCERVLVQMGGFVAREGAPPAVEHCWITNGAIPGSVDPGTFPRASADKLWAMGVITVLDVRCDTAARINNGNDDAYYRQFARDAKAFGHPLFMRGTGWEFNITTIHSCGTQAHPADFVRAWRRVHNIFRQEGATNVAWVWCPAAQAGGADAWYPGDAFVDWIAADHYPPTGGRQDFADSPLPAFFAHYLLRHKPMAVAETAAMPIHQESFLRSVQTAAPLVPGLKMVLYFDTPSGPNAGRDNSPWPIVGRGIAAWKALAASPFFRSPG